MSDTLLANPDKINLHAAAPILKVRSHAVSLDFYVRMFHLLDPDQHVLRFGSEPQEDHLCSEWVAWYSKAPPPAQTGQAQLSGR